MNDVQVIHAEITERIAAAEGLRPERVTHLTDLRSGEDVGEVTTFSGLDIDKAVSVEMRFDDGLTPAWINTFHVFAPVRGLVPHLEIEWTGSVQGDDRIGLLLDLLPRIDLAVNLDYVDEVYGPLTSDYQDVRDIPDVNVERVPPRRAVAMSAWRVSVSVPSDQVAALVPVVETYVDRWLTLRSGGVSSTVDPLASDQTRLIQHDRYHRGTLFDPASDPLWERVDRLIGPDEAAEVRLTLRAQAAR